MTAKPEPSPICRCGCKTEAIYRVEGVDIPLDGGKPYTEHCCVNAMIYLRDASREHGLRFNVTMLPNHWLMQKISARTPRKSARSIKDSRTP